MLCKDDSLTYLNEIGYNVIKLPREAIDPLLVLAGPPDNLSVIGPLSDFIAGGPPPQATRDVPAADISFKKTNRLKASLGLKLIDGFLSHLCNAGASVSSAYSDAAQIQILLQNVLTDSVAISVIANFIDSLPPTTGTLMDLIRQSGVAYLITDTAKSNAFGVQSYDASSRKLAVDAKGVQEVLGASAGVSISADAKGAITYQGNRWLRFGFKAVPFWVDDRTGKPRFRIGIPSGNLIAMKGISAHKTTHHVLLSTDGLLDL